MKKFQCLVLCIILLVSSLSGTNAQAAGKKSAGTFVVSDTSADIRSNGFYHFARAFYIDQNGIKKDVTDDVTWSTQNPDIATVYKGDINGIGKGETTIMAVYKGITKTIDIKVHSNINIEKEMEFFVTSLNTTVVARAISPSEVYIQKAASCKDVRWVPQKNLIGWGTPTSASFIYKAGITYGGIPYSKTPNQCYANTFASKLGLVDFYSTVYDSGNAMPRYGMDCSAYLSYCWGISRNTTLGLCAGIKNGTYGKRGSYTVGALTPQVLQNAYLNLQRGDGLVCNKGYQSSKEHALLVSSIDFNNKIVYVYEQTVEYVTNGVLKTPATRVSGYPFSQLASLYYMPFYKK